MAEWIQRGAVLTAGDAVASDLFSGVSISRDGLVLAVGAVGRDSGGLLSSGGIYIYDESDGAWVQRGVVIVPADSAAGDRVWNTALNSDGTVLVAGARQWEGSLTNQGGVYTWDFIGGAWVQRGAVLTAPDAAADDEFGRDVALSADGNVLAVGADLWEDSGISNRGAVYIFDRDGTTWTHRQTLSTVDDGSGRSRVSEAFGKSVALSSGAEVLAVGTPGWEPTSTGTQEGGVFVYDLVGTNYVLRGTSPLSRTSPVGTAFGMGVALDASGDVITVGQTGYPSSADLQGAVYIFDWSGTAWVLRDDLILTASDAANGDNFGIHVDISGSGAALVVGASDWEGSLTNQGGVYTFDTIITPPQTIPIIPLILSSVLSAAAAAVPLRLLTYTATAAQDVPMVLQSPSAAHFTAAAARWTVAVVLDGATVAAAQIVGAIEIAAEEDASSTCTLSVLPAAGVVDPRVYEGQPLIVWFVGLSSAGAELYRVRRFTGVVETAEYDPDAGTLRLSASTDLQGTLERADRATVDTLLPGSLWSEHVFDADADSYQYARDRISTLPSEMHIDEGGAFRLVAWAAKATADITYTDAGRFGDTLRLRRAARRDLITRVTIDLDFRYVRLRQRNLTVQLVPRTLCDYLDNGYELPSRETVRAAADGGAWTRVSAIQYAALPGPIAAVCTPQRAWAGGADDFCLGASWTAGRRWAQTVTEEYVITVVAGDLEEAVGTLPDAAAYGIEAVYDATDYETMRDFSTAPVGSVFDPAVDDYTAEATAAERTGRTAMALAQRTAIAAARTRILSRARGTTVELEGVYRPDLSLDKTLAVDSPYLTCRGKCAAYSETLDLGTGALSQQVTIALSRHDGSGLVVDDPVEEAAAPTLPAETSTGRYYAMTFRLGGTIQSPADDEDWDGWMTNVSPLIQSPGANLYRTRLVVRMPEIEDAARNATTAPQAATHAVAVPQDPLTLSA